jgi:CO/xanthine dehydrogenase FAD-binding subunit
MRLALGIGGVGDRAIGLDVSQLIGTRLEAKAVTEAVTEAAADLDAMSDLHASADYRRRVAVALGARAVADAAADAASGQAVGGALQ